MEVEVSNSGLLKNNFTNIQLEKEGNLAKYIAMITLAMEYIESFGANHGKIDCEHIYVSKNEENGEVTLKLSNIRSQMLKREEFEN
jgi:DNA-binding XRE family transcriptional regulator